PCPSSSCSHRQSADSGAEYVAPLAISSLTGSRLALSPSGGSGSATAPPPTSGHLEHAVRLRSSRALNLTFSGHTLLNGSGPGSGQTSPVLRAIVLMTVS